MRALFSIIRFLFLSVFIVLAELTVTTVFSWPLDLIQVSLLCLSLILVFTESRFLIWQAALIFYCLEFYSPWPFGVLLFSGTLATLLGFWLYQNIVTNRSWYSAIGLVTCMIIFFHIFQLGGIFLFSGTEQASVFLSPILFIRIVQEIFFTAVAIGFIVAIWLRGERKKRYGSIISWISRTPST